MDYMNMRDEGISAQQHVNFATLGELDFRSNLFFTMCSVSVLQERGTVDNYVNNVCTTS